MTTAMIGISTFVKEQVHTVPTFPPEVSAPPSGVDELEKKV